MDEFDVIVIGTGPAGQVCAGELAEAGLAVAAVEADLVGGECAFYSCMPSKALLRPEELRREVGRVPGLHPGADGPIDPETVLRRRDEVVRHFDDSPNVSWLDERGVEVVRGAARLDGPLRVIVENNGSGGDSRPASEVEGSAERPETNDRQLRARRAVMIATGSGAVMPPIQGLEDVGAWNNRQGTTAQEVPRSMVVLGGGPVGCELAQAWASLGTEVTLIEAADRLLSGEEPFASDLLNDALSELGVKVLTGAEMVEVKREESAEGGDVTARLADGSSLRAAEIVVAVGRKPHVEGLGLGSVGLESSGPIEVDSQMRAVGVQPSTDYGGEGQDAPWLYAVGDVNGRVLLTHMGKYQARIAVADILGKGLGDGEPLMAETMGSPRVTFTDPQVAAVGLTEEEAGERGIRVAVAETATSGTPGASFYGRGTEGRSRLIVDAERDVLVGATFVGFNTAEMLHAATIAIVGEVPIERLRHAVPSFPTRNEIWLRLLDRLP